MEILKTTKDYEAEKQLAQIKREIHDLTYPYYEAICSRTRLAHTEGQSRFVEWEEIEVPKKLFFIPYKGMERVAGKYEARWSLDKEIDYKRLAGFDSCDHVKYQFCTNFRSMPNGQIDLYSCEIDFETPFDAPQYDPGQYKLGIVFRGMEVDRLKFEPQYPFSGRSVNSLIVTGNKNLLDLIRRPNYLFGTSCGEDGVSIEVILNGLPRIKMAELKFNSEAFRSTLVYCLDDGPDSGKFIRKYGLKEADNCCREPRYVRDWFRKFEGSVSSEILLDVIRALLEVIPVSELEPKTGTSLRGLVSSLRE